MKRVARGCIVVVLWLTGCASNPRPIVHSCDELYAMHPTYPYWDISGIACDGFGYCLDIPCGCGEGRVHCAIGLADSGPPPDVSRADSAAQDASADAGP